MYDPRYAGFFIRCGSIYHRATKRTTAPAAGRPRPALHHGQPAPLQRHERRWVFWDFRNAPRRRYSVCVVGGPTGTGSKYVDGVFFDDAGLHAAADAQAEQRAIAAHAGLSDADLMDVANATHRYGRAARVDVQGKVRGCLPRRVVVQWLDDHVQGDIATKNWWSAPTAGDTCRSFYTSLCGKWLQGPVAFTWNPGRRHGGWDLPDELSWRLAVGTFLLLRPLQAWFVTSTWIDGPEILWDSSLELDVGEPVGNCTQRGSVFTREWSRGSVHIDCGNLSSTVLDFKQARST